MGETERESEACGWGDGDGGGGVAMETPQRNQITTSIYKFEDSPVFNFINSLSPIKSVRSTHITQSFNSLNLACLPSVFTSPHVSSLKESRVLRRHHFPDPSEPEVSSENGNKEAKNEGSVVVLNTVQHRENIDPLVSVGEASVQSSYENSKLATELSGILVYDYVSTDCSSTPCCVAETKYVSEMSRMSSSLVPFVQNVSGKGLFSSDMHVEGQIDQSNDAAGSDWDNLISDAADLLIFDSPNNAETFKGSGQKSVDSGKRFCSSFINDLPKIQADGAVGAGEQYETENPSNQPGEGNYSSATAEAQVIPEENPPNNCVAGGMSVKMANESDSNLYRGTRRRCLVFEMAGAYKKHLDGCSSSRQPDGNIPTNDKQLASIRPKHDSPRCILPGIGLHLNALATTRKFSSAVNSEALVCREQGMSVPTSSASFSSLPTSEELSSTSLAVMITSEINTGPLENGVPVVEDTSQASGYVGNEELNQSSPKKKRRKLEYAGENEGCKRCNCKKSKCLKLYCECFAAGLYCVEPCSCLDCFNKPVYEDTVLATRKQIESRNPLAFAPKVIRSSDTLPETRDELNKTPASARHKRGCNCKKSGCLKKYCECYQGGVGCSINCRCEGCKNAFGRKDGSTLIGNEADLEEDAETCEKAQLDTNLQKAVIQNDAEQNLEGPPETPLRFGRQSVGLPFSSTSKPPRSLLSIGSSSGMSANERLGKQNIFPPMSKLGNDFKTIPEDELPEILQGSGSPSSVVKSSSPNSKRISPPHCEFEPSPGRRSSRKLILKSIPSFPSLTPKH